MSASFDLAGYRRQLGVVPQEPYLFPGTIRDAIAYGRPDATDAEVEAAARGVGAIEMIARLPGGFMHEVSERGRNLSAGQRQLIALARAYLVDPAILLLDEATAALDLAAEAAVNRATEQLAARRTTLVVAHRLTTASRADRIIVVEGGRVAETGTHDELLAADGATRRCGPRSPATPSWSPDPRPAPSRPPPHPPSWPACVRTSRGIRASADAATISDGGTVLGRRDADGGGQRPGDQGADGHGHDRAEQVVGGHPGQLARRDVPGHGDGPLHHHDLDGDAEAERRQADQRAVARASRARAARSLSPRR